MDPLRDIIAGMYLRDLGRHLRCHPAGEYLDALAPLPCRTCGAPTGSVALEECEGCERARAAVDMLHGLAVASHARARLEAHE